MTCLPVRVTESISRLARRVSCRQPSACSNSRCAPRLLRAMSAACSRIFVRCARSAGRTDAGSRARPAVTGSGGRSAVAWRASASRSVMLRVWRFTAPPSVASITVRPASVSAWNSASNCAR